MRFFGSDITSISTCKPKGVNTLARAVIEGLEPRRLMSVNVLTWHNDAGRTGLNPNEQILTPANVNSASFGELFSYPVVGQVYAQPLYVSNLAIPGMGTHNVIFVATQDNDVYAFDANSNTGATGGLLWHVNLGLAASVPNSYFGNRYGPYHDIGPQIGITSTPVIDPSSGTLYVDAFTNDVGGQNVFSHHIHALNIATGQDRVAPMLVAASVKGNGVGGDGTTVTFSAEQQLQRPALTLLNGILYVTYGGYADSDPYHGWILGFNPATLQLQSIFNDTPNLLSSPADDTAGEAGIWQGGAGLASDGTNLYLMIGNGDFNAALGDYGDSILKLAPDGSTVSNPNLNGYGLGVSDYFTPYNQQQLSDADEDLGSGGGVVVPVQTGPYPNEYIGGGKQGIIYVVNLNNMGKYSATADNVVQEVNVGNGFFSSPAYFNSAIYLQATGDVLKKYTLSNGVLSPAPAAQTTIAYAYPGATPSISSNGTANGIVWDMAYGSNETLHAYDANTLTELYNSNQNAARDQMGLGVKFTSPTVADGEVFVGLSNAVDVFGLLAPPTSVPAAPSNLLATAASASVVNLTWVNNSSLTGGFILERSTDNVNFAQIALVSANATSYTDSSASANTTYYYTICATNIFGSSAFTSPSTPVTTPSGTDAVDIYHFDEGTGTSTADSAGTYPGTLVGATLPQWVSPGKLGTNALSFSGDGTYNQTASESAVKVGTDLSTILGSTSTLDVWINTTQVGNNVHWQAPAITGVEQQYGSNDINWGTVDSNGRIGIFVGDSGGVYSTSPINDGQWHNIAITRDAATGIVQLFVDGVLNGTATLDTGNKTSQFFLIGALSDVAIDGVTRTGNSYFNGKLDELRLYNKVLGQAGISQLATIPAAPTLQSAVAMAGPVAHLIFSSPSTFAQSLEVDRMTGSSGTYVPVATLPAGSMVYDDSAITAGITYSYLIKAIDTAGASPPSNIISVTPPLPTVVGNYIFYNNSKFDGNNGSSNLTDDAAIATDKTALLPGGTASFANITNYSLGINGIMIDVANLVGLPRVDDFTFMVGNDNNPTSWVAAPSPTYVNNYPGRGPNGSTQITLIWDDDAIKDEWLQVTMLAQPHLGLAANDVFYFGNAIGDTGDGTTDSLVTSNDAARVTSNAATSASVANVFDINRDGAVNATDTALVNSNLTTKFNGLNLISLSGTVPNEPTGVTATGSVAGASIQWTAAPGAATYNIYRGTTSGGEGNTPLATGVTATTYTDKTATGPATYYYFVTALNASKTPAGGESARSVEVSAGIPDNLAPTVPTAVIVTGTTVSSVSLGWTASTDNVGVTLYTIYRGTTVAGTCAGTVTTFTDSGLTASTAYSYTVVASDAVGNRSAASTAVIAATVSGVTKLTGTVIGTAGSYSGTSVDTISAVFDGSFSTYFDPAATSGLTAWVGLDLGSPQTITQIKYAPRSGYASRMVGAQLQVSSTADFSSNVVTLYTITAVPVVGSFTAVTVSPSTKYRYVRYVGGTQWVNIAEMEVDGIYLTPPTPTKLPGTPIGTLASWAGTGDTISQVFDGSFTTFFDAANSSLTNWVGLDMGGPQAITQIKYAPRAGYESRMINGQFQVSSTPDFSSNVVTLYTILTTPVAGQFTTIFVNPALSYRYVRYVGGTSWVNIAEMEIDGTYTAPVETKLAGTVIGTPTSWLGTGDTIAQVFDGNLNTYYDAANNSLTNWAGLDLGATHTLTQIKYAPRAGFEYRMVGGQFQVSNSATFASGVVTLYTISTAPVAGQFTNIYVSTTGYRYIRYIGGTSWVNIAEMEVDGV